MSSLKLSALLIKTLSKPLAKSIKRQAAEHPRFKALCIDLAQNYHRIQHSVSRRFNGRGGLGTGGTEAPIRPLRPEAAVERGADFLSEAIIFSTAAAIIIAEGWRSSNKSSSRKQSVDASLSRLVQINEEMMLALERLETRVQKLDPSASASDQGVAIRIRERWSEWMEQTRPGRGRVEERHEVAARAALSAELARAP